MSINTLFTLKESSLKKIKISKSFAFKKTQREDDSKNNVLDLKSENFRQIIELWKKCKKKSKKRYSFFIVFLKHYLNLHIFVSFNFYKWKQTILMKVNSSLQVH